MSGQVSSFLQQLAFVRSRAAQRRMAPVIAAFVVAGGLYAFLAPRWFRSVLTVLPVKQQRGGISGLLGPELAGLAAGLDAGGGGAADAARISAVLQSITVTDAVIDKFDLRQRYGETYQETARAALWRHCEVKALPKPNLVQLSCEDQDPRFVQAMLDYFAEYGNQVFRRVGASSASEEVAFLEKRVKELRQQADEAASRMREFQETHKIVDLDTQAKAVVSAMAQLNSERMAKQLELDYARTFATADEPSVRTLESQLGVMGRRMRTLEDESAADGGAPAKDRGVFPTALSVPRLRTEFETLYRDRKVAEATLIYALERLEGARANVAREVSTFQVLDPPALPTRHSRPKRSYVLALSLLLGVAAAVGAEWWRTAGAAAAAKVV
jgi:tyrosine-protein kinase Etk/Wzc